MAVLLAVGAAVPGAAQGVAGLPLGRGEVAFDGHGTLGDFTGRTTRISGMLTGAATLDGVRGHVELEAATLATGNGRRDRDMRASLEVQRFPVLRFDLDDVVTTGPASDSTPVTLRGRFTIHGVTRESAVRGWAWVSPGAVSFRGRTPMTITDYGIGGLSKAIGLLKMDPDIVVRMHLVFTR